MPTITSPDNERLKLVRKLTRRRRVRVKLGLFVAEGEDLLAAADAAGWQPRDRFALRGSGLPGTELEPELIAGCSTLGSSTRALAVYGERWQAAPLGRLRLHLHGVRDPGNVGTILRAAAAFGAGSVSFGERSADPFSPRAVRASMGAIFTVPVVRTAASALRGVLVALDAHAPRTLAQVADDLGPLVEVTLLVGAERSGLPSALLTRADHVARIPIITDSLNAAIAAAIGCYELTRAAGGAAAARAAPSHGSQPASPAANTYDHAV